MDTKSYKTLSINKKSAEKKWLLIDAEGEILGRLASIVAFLLRGKHKPSYTPHVDCGDNVVIINAEKIKLTGKKMTDKTYVSYSGYPGGQSISTPEDMMAKYPERILEKAVKGMLPKNRLGSEMFRNLKVYVGTEHKQEAQNPEKFDINTIK